MQTPARAATVMFQGGYHCGVSMVLFLPCNIGDIPRQTFAIEGENLIFVLLRKRRGHFVELRRCRSFDLADELGHSNLRRNRSYQVDVVRNTVNREDCGTEPDGLGAYQLQNVGRKIRSEQWLSVLGGPDNMMKELRVRLSCLRVQSHRRLGTLFRGRCLVAWRVCRRAKVVPSRAPCAAPAMFAMWTTCRRLRTRKKPCGNGRLPSSVCLSFRCPPGDEGRLWGNQINPSARRSRAFSITAPSVVFSDLASF